MFFAESLRPQIEIGRKGNICPTSAAWAIHSQLRPYRANLVSALKEQV